MELDKKLHFICGFIICFIIGLYNAQLGLVACAAAGAGKEMFDFLHPEKHSVELMDFIATCCGGIVAYILLKILWGA